MLTTTFKEIQGNFNPRPPWGGRRQSDVIDEINASFQSTPSVGRATGGGTDRRQVSPHFNPRPPWGGRHYAENHYYGFNDISIHARRGEGDERT